MEEKIIIIDDYMSKMPNKKQPYEILGVEKRFWEDFEDEFCEALDNSKNFREFYQHCQKFSENFLAMMLAEFSAGLGILALREVYLEVYIVLGSCFMFDLEKYHPDSDYIDSSFLFEKLKRVPKELLIAFLWFMMEAIGQCNFSLNKTIIN